MRKINQGYLKCKKKVSPVKTFKLEKQASKLLIEITDSCKCTIYFTFAECLASWKKNRDLLQFDGVAFFSATRVCNCYIAKVNSFGNVSALTDTYIFSYHGGLHEVIATI